MGAKRSIYAGMAALAACALALLVWLADGYEARFNAETAEARGLSLRQIASLLERYLERRLGGLHAVAAYFETTPEGVANEGFPTFAGLMLQGVTGYQALAWIDAGLQIRAVQPPSMRAKVADLALGQQVFALAQDSAARHRVRMSDLVTLSDGSNVLIALEPFYRQGRLGGLAMALFEPSDALADALPPELRTGMAIRIFDQAGRQLYRSAVSLDQVEVRLPVRVGDLQWTLALETPPTSGRPWGRRLIWGFGLATLALLEVWFYREARRKALLENLVSERTADLLHTVERLETLLGVGSRLLEARSEQGVGQRVTDAALDLVGADCSALFVSLPEGIEVRASSSVEGFSPLPPEAAFTRADFPALFGAMDSVSALTWTQGEAWEATEAERNWIEANDIRFLHCSPVGVPVRGLLVLAGARQPLNFMPTGEQVVQLLASQAALALNNVQTMKELAEVNEELRRADAQKAQFLSNVAHDVRTPLNWITGYASLLRDPGVVRSDLAFTDIADSIAKGADRLGTIVDDILDATQAQSGPLGVSLEAVRLGPIVQNVVEQMSVGAAKPDVQIALTPIPKDLPPIWADTRRLEQVLRCVLGNAVKFTHRGTIHVAVEPRPNGREIDVTVRDSGVGIPAADLEHIFDRHYQARRAGTSGSHGGAGIGLFLARALLDEMGGEVHATGNQGQGSTFIVTLIVARE